MSVSVATISLLQLIYEDQRKRRGTEKKSGFLFCFVFLLFEIDPKILDMIQKGWSIIFLGQAFTQLSSVYLNQLKSTNECREAYWYLRIFSTIRAEHSLKSFAKGQKGLGGLIKRYSGCCLTNHNINIAGQLYLITLLPCSVVCSSQGGLQSDTPAPLYNKF